MPRPDWPGRPIPDKNKSCRAGFRGRSSVHLPLPDDESGPLHMRILLTLLVLSSLTACAGMLLGSGTTPNSRAPSEQTPASRQTGGQSNADRNVSGALRQQFSADREISQFGVGIRSVAGRVTLTGTVGSYAVRDRIVDIARKTRGVVSVDNRLVVNSNR